MSTVLGTYTVQQGLTTRGEKRFRALYGGYLLQTHQIWTPELNDSDWFHLAAPPRDLEGYHAISHAVARCDRIASLLSRDPLKQRLTPRPFASFRGVSMAVTAKATIPTSQRCSPLPRYTCGTPRQWPWSMRQRSILRRILAAPHSI